MTTHEKILKITELFTSFQAGKITLGELYDGLHKILEDKS